MVIATIRSCLLSASCLVVVYSCSFADDADLTRRSIDAWEKIRSYHCKIAAFTPFPATAGSSIAEQVEVWQSGLRRRELRRAFRVNRPSGPAAVSDEFGRVYHASFGDTEIRSLSGWDPEHPLKLPLEFGRNSDEFGRVKGSITFRDVGHLTAGMEHIAWLHWVVPGHTLSDLISQGAVIETVVEQGSRRLKLESSSDAALAEYIGTTILVDSDNGWMISKIERPDGMTYSVDEFSRFADNVCIPTRSQLSENGQVVVRWESIVDSINESLHEEDLVVQFPPGARVDDLRDNRIHIWGDGGPAESFNSFKDFEQRLYQRARDYQSRNLPRVDLTKNARPETMLILIVNGVLIGLLILFTCLRRRLSRAGGPPSAAS